MLSYSNNVFIIIAIGDPWDSTEMDVVVLFS